jgi:hypothetical protein
MSYDSIRMLEEARSSVMGGIFPAAPVYVLRFFDIGGHGPTSMIQAQNFILLLSMALILRVLGTGLVASAIALIAVIAMPTVVGCMLVLWKDVTTTSLVMLSLAMTFWASQKDSNVKFYQAAKWSSLILLLVGTLIRFNAITSTAIITLYWLTVFYGNRGWKFRGAAFIAIVVCMMASTKVVNNYRFPSFEKLEANTILYGVMAYDLIGISKWSHVSLIPFDPPGSAPSPKIPISDIENIYSSLGSEAMKNNNKNLGGKVQIFPKMYEDEDIAKAWLGAIAAHPMAYLRYRWDLFSEIIGAKAHGTYEPTHFKRIDDNDFGIKFQDRYITDIALKYIESVSKIFLGKPWFVFLLSSLSVLLVFKSRLIRPEFKKFAYYSFVATVLYIIPFLVVTASGEVRYSFPAIVFSCNPIIIWIFARNQALSTNHC